MLIIMCIFYCLLSVCACVDTYLIFVCCREGSVVAHFWLVMSVPVSHVGTVTLEKVTESLEKGLRRYAGSMEEEVACFNGYIIHVPTLFVSGEYRGGKGSVLCVC